MWQLATGLDNADLVLQGRHKKIILKINSMKEAVMEIIF
jgi:hypothetical protein